MTTTALVATIVYGAGALLLLAGHRRRLLTGTTTDRLASMGICLGWPLLLVGTVFIVTIFWLVERIDQAAEHREHARRERNRK